MNLRKIILVLAVLSPLLLLGFFSSLKKETALLKTVRELRKELSALERANSKLRDITAYFTLRANIEREAKLRLNLAKPGETVVVFISPSPVPSPAPSIQPIVRFWNWLRKWDR